MTIPMDSSSAPSSWDRAQHLFDKNIEFENDLRKSAQARIPSDPNIWLQMRENFEAIILEDHEFSEKHEVEFMLWQLHYRRIEEFRAHINVAKTTGSGSAAPQVGKSSAKVERVKKIRSAFKSFLSEATGFYHDLILKIRAKYGLPLGYFSEGPESQIILSKDEKKIVDMKNGLLSCHRCLIYLGDLARYKGMYGEGDSVNRDFSAASSYYLQAASLWPASGNPHHQLAILASYSSDDLVTVYRYFRSLAVDNPFSTARDNLIIAFEKNRQKVAQLTNSNAASSNAMSLRSTGRGRGRVNAKLLSKDGNTEASMKEQVRSLPEIFKAFSIRFVRLHGILFTRTSLETFGDVFVAVMSDLNELLSSGPDEAFNFGLDASENGLFFVRLVSIFIFTVHNVNKNSDGQSYAEILQRSVLLQNAFTASFEFAGHILKRCIELTDVASSYLLPGIMVFLEWLACHGDIAAGFDVEEKQATSRLFFWSQCVSFMNALLSNGYDYLDTNEDESCFFDMGRYDEGETGNRLALWEDFELRGFLPLVQAHLILDFSGKRSAGCDGIRKEREARVQRIFAAGKALMNAVKFDQQGIYYDQHLKKFAFGVEPPATLANGNTVFVDVIEPSVIKHTSSVGSISNLGGSQSGMVDFGLAHVKTALHLDGEEDEEEIVFKPTVFEKNPNMFVPKSNSVGVQPLLDSSKERSGTTMTHCSPFHDMQTASVPNVTSKFHNSIANMSANPMQHLKLNTSRWPTVEEAALSDTLMNMNIGNGLMLQGDFSSFKPTSFAPPTSVSVVDVFSNQVTDAIIPSPLDSVLLPGATSNGLSMRTSTELPTVSKKNPVSRPARYFGPPPGFSSASSKQQDGSIYKSTAQDQNFNVDDYSWLDGYQQSSVKPVEASFKNVSVIGPRASTVSSSTFGDGMSFPFPGKQISPMQTNIGYEKPQDFQLFNHPKPFAEQHVSQVNFGQAMQPEQLQAQSLWSGRYFV
ncbi:Protein SMG7 [Apostasia shenzhenica]|uniref:Protein SMG7 n=1 Tax=Apostasia shenzhenica TaxID=1088818 RepID=A0A2I0B3S7_9ASPA|nr:Protein SMG7 [Apostasia shenzhenica]